MPSDIGCGTPPLITFDAVRQTSPVMPMLVNHLRPLRGEEPVVAALERTMGFRLLASQWAWVLLQHRHDQYRSVKLERSGYTPSDRRGEDDDGVR